MTLRRNLTLVLLSLSALATTAASAQATYPSKPIRIVVPYAAGSPPDVVTRVLAHRMSEGSVALVVENKPGASGSIALAELMRQPSDGYTLMTMLQPITVAPEFVPNFQFDLSRDIQPVGQFTRYSNGNPPIFSAAQK